MANRQNTLLLMRSNIIGKIPPLSGLTLGEMALNTADAKLYSLYTSGSPSPSEVRQIGWDRISRTGDTVFGDFEISGSSLPSGYALSVTGDTNFVGDILVEGNVGIGLSGTTAKLHINNTTSGNTFLAEDNTNPDSSPFVIDASGNTGIGTTTPQAKLDVRAQGNLSTDIAFRVRNSGDTGNLFAVRGDSNTVIGDETLVDRDIIYLSNRFIRFQNNGLNVTNWFASAPPVDVLSSHKFGFNNNSLFEFKGDSSLHIGLPGINQFSMALRVNSTQNILEGFRNAFGTNVKELRIRTGEPFTTGGIPYNSGNIVLQTGSGFNGGLNGDIIFQISSGLTEVSRITSTGLGIGTSTPREKLDVSGNTIISSGLSASTVTITTQPTSGYTSTQILMRNSTSGQVEITNSTSPSIYNYGMSYAMTTFNYLT